MTNLETLHKQQLEAMNQIYTQTLFAITGTTTMAMPQVQQVPQSNISQLENQLAQMQANMQQMMQMINQQQQIIQAQQSAPTMTAVPTTPVYVEPIAPKHVVEPAPAAAQNEDVFKVSSKLVKSCDSCPFAQTCGNRTKQGIGEQCGQEVMMNKQIMLQGGKMQARFNLNTNELELLSNGKIVSVVPDIKSNQNKKFINFMVKNYKAVDVQIVSDQKQPNSIYTTCTVEVLGFAEEDLDVAASPVTPAAAELPSVPTPAAPAVDTLAVSMQEPVEVDEEGIIYVTENDFYELEEEYSLADDEIAYYDAIASTQI